MKVGEVIKRLEADGWVVVRNESSHRTLKKDGIKPNIAVSGIDRDEMYPGQLSDVRRKSGLPLR